MALLTLSSVPGRKFAQVLGLVSANSGNSGSAELILMSGTAVVCAPVKEPDGQSRTA